MRIKKLSIIIPCFNEFKTIKILIQRIFKLDLYPTEKEIFIVDDNSTDGTREFLNKVKLDSNLKVLFHDYNIGKGGAIKTALQYVTGDYIIIQDADLEYDPQDIKKMITYAEKNNLEVLYGSRNLDHNRYSSLWFYVGGKFITWVANVLYSLNLTDEPTGYKLIKADLIRKIQLECSGFDFCPEVTAKLARLGYNICEIPISYFPRNITEGKKIKYRDGIQALWVLIKNKFWRPSDYFNRVDKFIRYLRSKKILKFINNNDVVLDIGCGRNYYLFNYIKNKVKNYVGIDYNINSEHADKLLSLIKFDLDSFQALPLPDNYFNKIVMLAVIEHLDNYEHLIKESYKKLKAGGQILMTTPTPKAKPVLEFLAGLGIISKKEINDHKQYFSREALRNLLINAGFKPADINIKEFEFGFNFLVMAEKAC